jgi:hypothetical protein
MQTELNHTVKSLFGKESLDDMSRDDLLMMINKYPYAAILQFLYTKKLQSSHDLRYPAAVARTALYFSNPHWLHHQLRAKTSVEALAEMEMAFEKSHNERFSVEEKEISPVENVIEKNYILPGDEEVAEKFQHTKDDLAEQLIESTGHQEIFIDDISAEPVEELKTSSSVEEYLEKEAVEPVIENIQETPLEPLKEEIDLPEPLIDFPQAIEETANVDQEPATLENNIDKTEPEIDQDLPAELIGEQINKIALPESEKEPEVMEIPLEPLYAVDYFASQGIRLREEDQQDQLGKKLKSFTEWLKSMKKVHPEKSTGQMDDKTEAVIKSEAELSNDKAEVLTETMAEVFIKQGLTHKAIDVYEKLSLLDPLKSATFAAKISELKAQ